MRLIERSRFRIHCRVPLPWRMGSAADWPRPMRNIIYLRRWKIEWMPFELRARAVFISRSRIANNRNHSPSRCATRDPHPGVCLRTDGDFFFLICYYLIRSVSPSRARNDGGLKNRLDEGRRLYLRARWIYLANCLGLIQFRLFPRSNLHRETEIYARVHMHARSLCRSCASLCPSAYPIYVKSSRPSEISRVLFCLNYMKKRFVIISCIVVINRLQKMQQVT